MSAAANIVLADAQATPVNHTFTPMGPDPKTGIWWFEDMSAASPIGNNRISVEIRKPGQAAAGESSKDRNVRIRVGVHTPKLENVTNSTVTGVEPAPTLSYVPRAFTEYILPERCSLQDRKDIRKFVQFVQADTQIVSAVETLQGIW